MQMSTKTNSILKKDSLITSMIKENQMYWYIFIIFFISVILLRKYHKYRAKKNTIWRLNTEFGNKPNRSFTIEDIKYLYHLYSDDVDIDDITWNDLDMDKVFSRINNCNSFVGEQYLYKALHIISSSEDRLGKLDELVEYFEVNPEARLDVQVLLEKLGRRKVSYFLPEFVNQLNDFKFKNILFYRLMSLALISSILFGIIFDAMFFYIAGILFLVNSVIYTLVKHKYEIHLEMLGTIIGVVDTANGLIDMDLSLEAYEFQECIDSSKRLRTATSGIGLIQRKKASAFSGDIAAIIMDYIIGSTLWDFHVFHKTISVLSKNREAFMKLYNLIGRIDSVISIASYRHSLDLFCKPTFTVDKDIQFESIYHPLIHEPIHNDVLMNSNYIVTGSNASGKSTYIKSIGINMILAQSIFTCLAKDAKLPHAKVLTSMAVRDDIESGDSYYMKEISYLKRIVSQVNDDELTLCIVDEILRGTNREERVAASVSILKYLNKENCITIVASHDILISEMLNLEYENCHFTEHMKDDDIFFDYKVKEGVSNSTNAIKLLKHVGFPEDIVKHAEDIVSVM